MLLVAQNGESSWLSGLNLGTLLPLSIGLGNGGNGHVMLVPLLKWLYQQYTKLLN